MSILDIIAQGNTPNPQDANKDILDTIGGTVKLRQMIAESQAYQKDKPIREYNRKKAEMGIEIQNEHGDLMKQAEVDKLENTIGTLERQNKLGKLMDFTNYFEGVNSEETFQQAASQIPKDDLTTFGINPKLGFQQNAPKINYLKTRAMHTNEQLQKLELVQAKGMYSGTSGSPKIVKLQMAEQAAKLRGDYKAAAEIRQNIEKEITRSDSAWNTVLGPITSRLMQGQTIDQIPKGYIRALILTMSMNQAPFNQVLADQLNTIKSLLGKLGDDNPLKAMGLDKIDNSETPGVEGDGSEDSPYKLGP